MSNRIQFACTKTIEWSLIFIIAVIPLIINPLALDYWYRPKIESIQFLLLIATVAWFAKDLVKDRRLNWEQNSLNVPILFYAAAAILSTMFSVNVELSLYGDPLRLEGLCTLILYLLLVFLFINQVKTPNLAGKLFIGLILCATLVSIYALFQYFFYNPTEHFIYKYIPKGNGVGSTIGNPNFLGKFLVLIIPIVFALYLGEFSQMRVVCLLFSLSLCFSALMATFTRGSWLGFLVGIAIFLLFAVKNALLRMRNQRLVIIGIILFIIVVLFNNYSPSHGISKVSSPEKIVRGEVVQKTIKSFDINKGRGVATRLYVWEKTLLLIKDRPLLGYGLETFILVFKQYNRDYINIFRDLVIIDRAHNNYIDTAFSLGLIGLAAYLAILSAFLKFLWDLTKQVNNRSRKLFYTGILSGFCGYLVNDFFIFSVVSVSPTFWSLMGLTVAAGRIDRMKNTINKTKSRQD